MGKVKKRQAAEEVTPPSNSSSDSDDEPTRKKAKTKPTKKPTKAVLVKFEEEEDDEMIVEDEEIGEFWPTDELLKLFSRMEKVMPQKDKHKFESAADKLDWDKIAFETYTADDCKAMWQKVSLRQRRYRLLKELIEDAKKWVEQPWTNFYRSQKTNRHPDMPKRPLSTYMMFYMEKKDRVSKEYPNLEMTKLSTIIAAMYKNLPDKQKQKYTDKAKVQREEFNDKMIKFYENHPELKRPKMKRLKNTKLQPGPKKPMTPIQHYIKEKTEKHKNETEEQRQKWLEHYKEAWKEIGDKKKVNWIKCAMEDEERFLQELSAYKEEHPDYDNPLVRSILNKEEKALYDKSVGKPEKPPNSGYSLFSRIMLSSEEIKNINHKDRMLQISSMWKNLSMKDKRKYADKVQQMLEQYKLDFATYLESLPPGKRQEELLSNTARRKPEGIGITKKKVPEKAKAPVKSVNTEEAANTKIKEPATKSAASNVQSDGIELFKGEPEAPPSAPFKLFLKDFLVSAKHLPESSRDKEAPQYWSQMADSEKLKWRKRLQELKEKYINKYENFLKSLTQEQLKEYSILKAKNNARREQAEAEKSENEDQDDDDGDDSSDSSDSDDSNSNDSDSDDSSSSSEDSD